MTVKDIARGTLAYIIALAVILGLWEAVSIYSNIIPGLPGTLGFLIDNLGMAGHDTVITLENTLAGFTLAVVLALGLAWASTLGGLWESSIKAFNVVVQSVSVLVWSLLFLILYGFTSRLPAVSVAAATAFPIMLSGAIKGFEVTRREYGELSLMLKMSRRQEFRHILAPGSLPFLIASARSGLGAALRISVVAEAFGSSGGIGYRLWLYYELHNYEGFMAWALLLVTLMLVLDKLVLERAEAWGRRWTG